MEHKWENYFDTESEYWKKIQEIYKENDNYPKVVVKNRNLHHKFPRSFSKKDGVEIDNDKDNLVSLSLASHFLVHYYLWKCSLKGYRQLMAVAFQFMRKKAIKYASEDTIEELAKDYEAAMKDALEYLSESQKGKKKSEEMKKKLSESNKGHTSWNKGKKFSAETKNKMAESHKGKKFSAETKNKMADAKKGKKRPEEIVKKVAEANKGKKRTEESRKRMSEGHKCKHWKLVDGKRVWY